MVIKKSSSLHSSPLLNWLFQHQQSGIVLGEERVRQLLEALGNPQRCCRCFHIAGTNGKGSVAAFSASILKAAGIRVGLYTSPHLVDFRERIQLHGEMISLEDLEAGIRRLQSVTHGWKTLPTFFELITALAFDYFARKQCEAVVLETGLGGRLDATNLATNKIACAITSIGLDHQEWLGSTLAAIAQEKAGIMRSGVPIVTGPQPAEVMKVLKEEAVRLNAPFMMVEEPVAPETGIGLEGSYQRWNAALALKLVQQGPWKLSREVQSFGLKTVSWPGRFQRCQLTKGQEIILDGAHNPAAAEKLVATWKEIFSEQQCSLIFGSLADKEGGEMLRILKPIASSIVLVSVNSPRAASPEELQKVVPSAMTFSSLEEVFKKKNIFIDSSSLFSGDLLPPILLTGSLFLVGEALALLEKGSYSPFWQ
jgi:dihydrofolate synthase/folylpolyglutamate synthase